MISFAKPNTKEKKLILEYRAKANELKTNYDVAKENADRLCEALDYFTHAIKIGDTVRHKKYGECMVKDIDNQYITLEIPGEGEYKRLALPVVLSNGIVSYDEPEFGTKLAAYKDVLKRAQDIPRALDYAVKALAPYEEYLE